MDEIRQVGYYYSTENVFHLIDKAASQQQPPLDYLIGYIIANFLPFHEIVVRLPSLVFGTAIIPLSYHLFALTYTRRMAMITSLLICFSPSLIYYSQEARPYSIFLVLLLLSLICFFQVVNLEEIKKWSKFRTVAFLMLLSRGLEPLIALASLFLTSLMLKDNFTQKSNPQLIRNLFRSLLQASLWFLPFFLLILLKSRKYLAVSEGLREDKIPLGIFDPFLNLFQSTLPGTLPQPFFLFLGLATGGLAISVVKRMEFPRFFFLSVFFVLFMIIHSYIFHYSVNSQLAQLAPKYLLYSHIPFLGLTAVFASESMAQLEKFLTLQTKTTKALANLIAGVLIFAFVYGQLPRLQEVYSVHKVDYRSAGKYLQENLNYGDVILHVSFLPYGSIEHDYWGEGLYYKKRVPIYSLTDLVKAVRTHPRDRRRIFVAIHEAPSQPLIAQPSQLDEFTAFGIKLIHFKNDFLTEDWREELDQLLTNLESIFPQENNSKAKLFLAQCQLWRNIKEDRAQLALEVAEQIAPEMRSQPQACP